MGWWNFGSKKVKSLEERAKEAGIKIGSPPSNLSSLYQVLERPIKGAGTSKYAAEDRLLHNAQERGAEYLSDFVYLKQDLVVSAKGYAKFTGGVIISK